VFLLGTHFSRQVREHGCGYVAESLPLAWLCRVSDVDEQLPARAASMKLHAAGMIEAHLPACMNPASPSVRPVTHGITCTGTS
jgi:hypothetical protein